MADLDALIARLEAAEGPDRQLDGAISECPGVVRTVPYTANIYSTEWMRRDDGGKWLQSAGLASTSDQFIPRYTSSLDAALTLVPEGMAWNVAGADPLQDTKPWALIAGREIEKQYGWDDPPEIEREVFEANATTPALALCIASLKARKAQT